MGLAGREPPTPAVPSPPTSAPPSSPALSSSPPAVPAVATPAAAAVPEVPPGPGVRPPFAAPPTDTDRTKLWIGLAIGIVAILVCCVGGVVGGGALLVKAGADVEEQSKAAVAEYLDALKQRDFVRAYSMRCGDYRRRVSLEAFEDRALRGRRLTGYEIQPLRARGAEIIVPVRRQFSGGSVDSVEYTPVRLPPAGPGQSARPNRFAICGDAG